MDRETYKRWHEHPLRNLLARAAGGGHVYPDELDDLRLPATLRRATEQAVRRVQAKLTDAPVGRTRVEAARLADHLSSELVEALPAEHETREEFERRRAAAGDATAQANLEARRQAAEDLADRITQDSRA